MTSAPILTSIISCGISAISVSFGIWSWRNNRKTQLKLRISAGLGPGGKEWCVWCECANRGSHKVYIKRAYITSKYSSEESVQMIPYEQKPDDRGLDARHSIRFYYPGEPLILADFDRLVFVVETDDGAMARDRERLLGSMALYVAAMHRMMKDDDSGENMTEAEIQRVAHLVRTEWTLRQMAALGIVEIEESDKGHVENIKFTRRGLTIARRVEQTRFRKVRRLKSAVERSHISAPKKTYRLAMPVDDLTSQAQEASVAKEGE